MVYKKYYSFDKEKLLRKEEEIDQDETDPAIVSYKPSICLHYRLGGSNKGTTAQTCFGVTILQCST